MKKYILEISDQGQVYIALKNIQAGESVITKEIEGELVDFDKDGNPLGIEIQTPDTVSLLKVIKILDKLEKIKK